MGEIVVGFAGRGNIALACCVGEALALPLPTPGFRILPRCCGGVAVVVIPCCCVPVVFVKDAEL